MRAQLDLNTQAVDMQTAEQKIMAKQIAEAGQAIAQLRIDQMSSRETPSSDSDSISSASTTPEPSRR